MFLGRKHIKAVAFGFFLTAGVCPASAQVIMQGTRPTSALKRSTVTEKGISNVSSMAMSAATESVNFAFTGGSATNPGSNSITVTLSWTCPACNTVSLYAYFTTATSAMTDGAGDNIPSSAFYLSDNGGAFRALNGTVPFGGANAGLKVVTITSPGRSGTHSDTMNFNIDLSTGTLPQLAPGSYTGTLTLQGQAQ